MSKSTLHKTIYVPQLKKSGKVIAVNPDGTPRKILSEGEVIEVVGLAFKIVNLLKQLFSIVKSLFNKDDK